MTRDPSMLVPRFDIHVIRHLNWLRASPQAAREASLAVLFSESGTRYLLPSRNNHEASVVRAAAGASGCSFAPVLVRPGGPNMPVPGIRMPGGGHSS
jgi:hypothetical protein